MSGPDTAVFPFLRDKRFSTVPVLWGYPQMLLEEVYTVQSLEFVEDVLRVRCVERGAMLTGWAPRQLQMGEYGLRIADAQRLRWDYQIIGRADLPPMDYFIELWRATEGIAGKSNSHWNTQTVAALVDKEKAAVLWPVGSPF